MTASEVPAAGAATRQCRFLWARFFNLNISVFKFWQPAYEGPSRMTPRSSPRPQYVQPLLAFFGAFFSIAALCTRPPVDLRVCLLMLGVALLHVKGHASPLIALHVACSFYTAAMAAHIIPVPHAMDLGVLLPLTLSKALLAGISLGTHAQAVLHTAQCAATLALLHLGTGLPMHTVISQTMALWVTGASVIILVSIALQYLPVRVRIKDCSAVHACTGSQQHVACNLNELLPGSNDVASSETVSSHLSSLCVSSGTTNESTAVTTPGIPEIEDEAVLAEARALWTALWGGLEHMIREALAVSLATPEVQAVLQPQVHRPLQHLAAAMQGQQAQQPARGASQVQQGGSGSQVQGPAPLSRLGADELEGYEDEWGEYESLFTTINLVIKLDVSGLLPQHLPPDYLQLVRSLVYEISAGKLLVMSGGAREGCVLLSLDALVLPDRDNAAGENGDDGDDGGGGDGGGDDNTAHGLRWDTGTVRPAAGVDEGRNEHGSPTPGARGSGHHGGRDGSGRCDSHRPSGDTGSDTGDDRDGGDEGRGVGGLRAGQRRVPSVPAASAAPAYSSGAGGLMMVGDLYQQAQAQRSALASLVQDLASEGGAGAAAGRVSVQVGSVLMAGAQSEASKVPVHVSQGTDAILALLGLEPQVLQVERQALSAVAALPQVGSVARPVHEVQRLHVTLCAPPGRLVHVYSGSSGGAHEVHPAPSSWANAHGSTSISSTGAVQDPASPHAPTHSTDDPDADCGAVHDSIPGALLCVRHGRGYLEARKLLSDAAAGAESSRSRSSGSLPTEICLEFKVPTQMSSSRVLSVELWAGGVLLGVTPVYLFVHDQEGAMAWAVPGSAGAPQQDDRRARTLTAGRELAQLAQEQGCKCAGFLRDLGYLESLLDEVQAERSETSRRQVNAQSRTTTSSSARASAGPGAGVNVYSMLQLQATRRTAAQLLVQRLVLYAVRHGLRQVAQGLLAASLSPAGRVLLGACHLLEDASQEATNALVTAAARSGNEGMARDVAWWVGQYGGGNTRRAAPAVPAATLPVVPQAVLADQAVPAPASTSSAVDVQPTSSTATSSSPTTAWPYAEAAGAHTGRASQLMLGVLRGFTPLEREAQYVRQCAHRAGVFTCLVLAMRLSFLLAPIMKLLPGMVASDVAAICVLLVLPLATASGLFWRGMSRKSLHYLEAGVVTLTVTHAVVASIFTKGLIHLPGASWHAFCVKQTVSLQSPLLIGVSGVVFAALDNLRLPAYCCLVTACFGMMVAMGLGAGLAAGAAILLAYKPTFMLAGTYLSWDLISRSSFLRTQTTGASWQVAVSAEKKGQ